MSCALFCLLALCACDASRTLAIDARAEPDATAADAAPGTPTTCALPAGAHADAIAFAAPDTLLYTYSDDGTTRWIARQDAATSLPQWLEEDTVIGRMITSHDTLYFTDANANVYSVDLDARPPSAIGIFAPSGFDASTRYGLAADAAGAIYTTDGVSGQERILRRPRGGDWSEVTTSPFTAGAIGSIVVAPGGDLFLVTLFTNQLWHLTIGPDGTEIARAPIATVADASGLDFGLARDETSALYVLSAGARTLTRLRPPDYDEERLAMPTGYLGGMAFGRGCWGTHNVYIANLDAVDVVDVGASGAP